MTPNEIIQEFLDTVQYQDETGAEVVSFPSTEEDPEEED